MSNAQNEWTDTHQKAYGIIVSSLDTQELKDITINSELTDIGFDSITFIKTIVALESEFDFEFDDEKLLITEFPTIKSMVEYVKSKISSNYEIS